MSERSTFRRLWQPPARFADRAPDRRISFLELFFDLVFVVVISQLAQRLAAHPSWSGVGWFVFLFYAVWSHRISVEYPRVRAFRARLLNRASFARAVVEARPYRHLFPLGAPDRD